MWPKFSSPRKEVGIKLSSKLVKVTPGEATDDGDDDDDNVNDDDGDTDAIDDADPLGCNKRLSLWKSNGLIKRFMDKNRPR